MARSTVCHVNKAAHSSNTATIAVPDNPATRVLQLVGCSQYRSCEFDDAAEGKKRMASSFMVDALVPSVG